MLHLGKPVEHLENAAKATIIKDESLRFLTIGKQLAYAGYLTFDGIIFVCLLRPGPPSASSFVVFLSL
jgi:peroxin-11B